MLQTKRVATGAAAADVPMEVVNEASIAQKVKKPVTRSSVKKEIVAEDD